MKLLIKTCDVFRGQVRVLLAILLMGGGLSFAQMVPVPVLSQTPVVDEFGQTLVRENGGDLVQFLEVNGQVLPPAYTGEPDPANTLLYTSAIGEGVIKRTWTEGLFAAAINPVPAENTPIVARVFNAPTLAEASFYADSQIFTTYQETVFYPVFTATTNPIDPRDDDLDGLNNSWEKSLGTNPLLADTDGDGLNDYHEFLAGTSPTDMQDVLAMVQLVPEGSHMRVQWDSVPGKRYQLQVADPGLGDPGYAFSNVNQVVEAVADTCSTVVTNAAEESGRQLFRIKLVQ